MDVTKFLDYGVLGILTLVLLGVGWGLKLVFARWLDQMDASIRAQNEGGTAMAAMAIAMGKLTEVVKEHSLVTLTEHRLLLEVVCKEKKVPVPKPPKVLRVPAL